MNTWREATLRYRSYLLRFWQETDSIDSTPIWRFSLEEVGEEPQRYGFSSLQALMAFLENQVEATDIQVQGKETN